MNADVKSNEPESSDASGGEEFSVIGLMASARLMGDHLSTLYFWDHTGDPDRAITGDPASAIDSLQTLQRFHEEILPGIHDEKMQTNVTETISTISHAIDGFRFREQHKLRNIFGQIEEIRSKLYKDQISEAGVGMELLVGQSDVTPEIITGLREEYKHISEIREAGGNPDIRSLFDGVFKVNHGLDFRSIRDCVDLLNQVRQFDLELALVQPLALKQGGFNETLWRDSMAHIPWLKAQITERVIKNLSFETNMRLRSDWRQEPETPPEALTPVERIRWEEGRMYKELKISIPAPPEDYQSWKSRLEQVQGSENMYITLRSQLQAELAVAEGKRINKALVFMNIKPQSVESIKRALRELDKGHEENVRLLKHGRYFLDAEEFVHQLEQFPLDDGSSTDETSVTSS